MHIFQHHSQVYQNNNGQVHKEFKIVKGNDTKVMEYKGISNKENPSLYHILKTLKKNNMVYQQYYKINEDDIMRLLKEGNEEKEMKNLVQKKKVENKSVEKKSVEKKSVKKKSSDEIKKKKNIKKKKSLKKLIK